jgi:hypothetical protein
MELAIICGIGIVMIVGYGIYLMLSDPTDW